MGRGKHGTFAYRAIGIAGNWEATALKEEVWIETATESGRSFMAAWRTRG